MHLGPLQKFALADTIQKILDVDEMVFATVLFTRTRRTCRT